MGKKARKITIYFHCRRCMLELPDETSMEEWARINVGGTNNNEIQIWCTRHDVEIGTFPTSVKLPNGCHMCRDGQPHAH